MTLEIQIERVLPKPIHEVFEAIVDPQKMKRYFITESSGPMQEGKTVTWTWADYNAIQDISIEKIRPPTLIAFSWTPHSTPTHVDITLTPIQPTQTRVHIRETGWEPTPEGIASFAENVQGWTDFLLSLKAYLQYGINLRS